MLQTLRAAVEAGLAGLPFPPAPAHLYDPVRYVLEGEGKRLRPLLVLLAARAYGAERSDALPAALAVEVFHNFTLVHDDIMDRAETRRGRPTVHVRWNEPVAILAGDLLLGEAFRLVAASPPERVPALMADFSGMVARLCEGQTLDMDFETRADVPVPAYCDMIARKTGALLECCLALGARIGGAGEGDVESLRRAGYHAGQAFQIQDDLLDLVADDPRWGKRVGGDLMEGKKTFLLLLALERAAGDDHAFFAGIVRQKGLAPEKVGEARRRMDALGVLDATRQRVRAETDAARDALGVLPTSPARDALVDMVTGLARRAY